MVVCTFVLNASDSSCGEAFFGMHLTMLFLCLTHKSTVFSKVEEEVTARDLQGGHTLLVWETLMCFYIEGDLWKLLPSERINQTLILLCRNESPRSEALIRLYYITDKWSTGQTAACREATDLSFQTFSSPMSKMHSVFQSTRNLSLACLQSIYICFYKEEFSFQPKEMLQRKSK